MDLKKVASYLRDASQEMRILREENMALREKVANLEKKASVSETSDFLGFGEVGNEPILDLSENPVEKLKMFLQEKN